MPKRSKPNQANKTIQKKYDGKKMGYNKSQNSLNPDRKVPEKLQGKDSHFRSKAKIKILKMYESKVDNKTFYKEPHTMSKIAPDRKWFGNVRTIDQKSLEKFRIDMEQQQAKPNEILLKKRKLPLSLLVDPITENKVKLLDIEKFEDTFGPKSRRKKPKINNVSYESMANECETQEQSYDYTKDYNKLRNLIPEDRPAQKDKRLEAGQSKRIWEELYKVLDSSDVILQVLDARDPMGTRCKHLEDHIKKNCPHKHLVFLINKCDLIPTSIIKKWIKHLSLEYPTIAYHASITNPFGKGSLINILRQFDNFHKDKQNISVGILGYPNVGKSSVINSLKAKRVCKAAPIPGETKVWQYITLTKRIYIIDCPGVVFSGDGKDETSTVLKGCIRAEKLMDPEYYIPALLKEAKTSDLEKFYGITGWKDHDEFLDKLARKKGKLIKGGEADLKSTAKLVLMDWQRGDIPYMKLPPNYVKKEKVNDEQKNQEQLQETQNVDNVTDNESDCSELVDEEYEDFDEEQE